MSTNSPLRSLTSTSTSSSGSAGPWEFPTAAILPLLSLSPTTNPWQETYNSHTTRSATSSPHSNISSPHHKTRSREKHRYVILLYLFTILQVSPPYLRGSIECCPHSPADGSPIWEDDQCFAGSSPPVTPVRLQLEYARTGKTLDHPLWYDMCSTLSPVSTVSTLPQTLDQSLSTHDRSLMPSRETRHLNCHCNYTCDLPALLSPPSKSLRTPCNEPSISNLHPDLAAVNWTESCLSKKGD